MLITVILLHTPLFLLPLKTTKRQKRHMTFLQDRMKQTKNIGKAKNIGKFPLFFAKHVQKDSQPSEVMYPWKQYTPHFYTVIIVLTENGKSERHPAHHHQASQPHHVPEWNSRTAGKLVGELRIRIDERSISIRSGRHSPKYPAITRIFIN